MNEPIITAGAIARRKTFVKFVSISDLRDIFSDARGRLFTHFWITIALIYSSQLGAWATGTGGGGVSGGNMNQTVSATTACAGFLCGPRAKLTATPPFSSYSGIIDMLFVGLNLVIVIVLGLQVFNIVRKERDGQEYQSLVIGLIVSFLAITGFNYMGAFVMG